MFKWTGESETWSFWLPRVDAFKVTYHDTKPFETKRNEGKRKVKPSFLLFSHLCLGFRKKDRGQSTNHLLT